MKEVKKQVSKVDFYLTIIDLIKEGKNPTQIVKKLNISKQQLNYYLKDLKKTDIIKKIGYGVWEFNEKDFKEVKILLEKLSQVAKFYRSKIREIPNFNIKKIRKILKQRGLYQCIICGEGFVELHHLKERKDGGLDDIDNIIPLCRNHHEYIHQVGLNNEIRKKIIDFHNITLDITVKNKIRGHAFMFKFKIPRIKNWNFKRRKRFLDDKNIHYKIINLGKKGQSIIIKGCKVWLLNNSIIIYTKESFIEDSAKKSKERAIEFLLSIIKELENIFKIDFKIKNTYKFKICRQHYSRLKDLLAIQCDKEGKKINVYNEKGLWFIIDNSYNLHESETVHPKTSPEDLDRVISPFLNDLQKNPTTFSEIRKIQAENALQSTKLISVTQNLCNNQSLTTGHLKQFGEQLDLHLDVLNRIGKGIDKLSFVVGSISKEHKIIKEKLRKKEQKTLDTFIK